MAYTKDSLWKTVDWWTILLYLILITCGWFSVCGASYDYGEPNFLDFTTRAGKQLMWIGCSLGLGFVLLMLEHRLYDTYAYLIYGILLLLLFGTIFNPHEIKGSRSWIVLGPVSLQPAEFAKFATALALAKFMGEYTFSIHKMRHALIALGIILLPMILIILQRETGSALVYLSFFLVLYREGMPGSILLAGICAVVYFIVGIRFGEVPMPDEMTSWGEFSVFGLIILLSGILVSSYCKQPRVVQYILLIGGGATLLGILFSCYVIPFDVAYLQYGLCVALVVWLILLYLRERMSNYFYIALFGDAGAPYIMIYYMVNTTLFWTIGFHDLASSNGVTMPLFSRKTLKSIMSPPLMGFMLGVVMVLLEWNLPEPVFKSFHYLGSMTTPLAMLFIGIAMSKTRWEEIAVGKELVVAMLGRYLICPWIVFLILPFFHLEPMMEKVFVIMAAMPAMTNTAIVAKGYGGDYKYAAMLTAVSTVLAVFAIPFYMWLVH